MTSHDQPDANLASAADAQENASTPAAAPVEISPLDASLESSPEPSRERAAESSPESSLASPLETTPQVASTPPKNDQGDASSQPTEAAESVAAQPKTPQEESKPKQSVDGSSSASPAEAQSGPEKETKPKEEAEPSEIEGEKPATAEQTQSQPAGEKTQPVYADPVAELAVIDPLLVALSPKRTSEINTLGNRLGEIRKQLPADAETAKQRGLELHARMVELLAENKRHQEAMSTSAHSALEELKAALDAGNSEASLAAWDKAQSAMAPLSGKLRTAVQKQLNEHRTRYQELKDWKLFASAEKKKELIGAMELLVASSSQPAERAKAISAAHKEWKSLGRSQQNESLWKKFKKLSDEAYAPCKEHFKQRQGALSENYDKRVLLCDELEAELSRLKAPSADEASEIGSAEDNAEKARTQEQRQASHIAKLINDAQERWKATAPVEQSKIKALKKRFYDALNALRKLRRGVSQQNAERKQQLIELAQALAENENRGEAMKAAKELQRQWKEVGPSTHKEDQGYWKEFRAACDSIFAREPGAQRTSDKPPLDAKQTHAEVNGLLDSLESLLALTDEEFRQARGQVQDLAQAFSAALDPRLGNRRKPLSERFNTLKRRLDTRYKALPDKRQQQRISAVSALCESLSNFEARLQSAADAEAFKSLQQEFDENAWGELERPDSEQLGTLLDARLKALKQAKDAQALAQLGKDAEQAARRLCTEIEISANAETPAEDKALRMQLQLEQLKAAFGQAKKSAADVVKHAREEELRLQCLGPLPSELRTVLSKRFAAAAAKLNRH